MEFVDRRESGTGRHRRYTEPAHDYAFAYTTSTPADFTRVGVQNAAARSVLR